MKKIFSIVIAYLLAFLSCKKEDAELMIIVRDCTGVYLRSGDKDYNVCNIEKTFPFPDASTVRVTFKRIDECDAWNKTSACYMLHENEGWIKIESIMAD